MAEIVTRENFVEAETAHYFREQLAKAPLNEYSHSRVPVNVETQVVIRSNVDLIYSLAVVDVTEEASFSLAPSNEYQIAQIIDENHYVVGVIYPGETLTVRNTDLSAGTHVDVAGRTATVGGLERAHELQDARRIGAATANPYQGRKFDEDTRKSVGAELDSCCRGGLFPGLRYPSQHRPLPAPVGRPTGLGRSAARGCSVFPGVGHIHRC
ncbi:hypothetical protein R3Q08_26640 [Rhodococcus erythropolis]|uniref:hypothetical protein n=1 Tax=Rhodococcus erythropolis TaxID=1833 RepID=UPI002949D3A2|nr:hypothetical protein [Rhodococcus erythropolis]MDV6211848.1 hypothetical protein [Rhodococcus erythropolis]